MVLDESLILYAFASFFRTMLIQNHNFSFYSHRNACVDYSKKLNSLPLSGEVCNK